MQYIRYHPDFDPLGYDISALRSGVDTIAEELEARHLAGHTAFWEPTPNDLEPLRPLLFENPNEIFFLKNPPPGPWRIALVDPTSLKVLELSVDEYCRQESGRY